LESFCFEAVVDGIEVNITEVFVGDDLVSLIKFLCQNLKELLKITYNGKEEIIDRINSTRDLTIDCPECEGMEDDQYTCTTCWCEGIWQN
jgi:hypothetical protein